MNVVLINTVALNGGDCAIVRATDRLLREAFGPIALQVFDSQPTVSARYLPFEFSGLAYATTRDRTWQGLRRLAIERHARALAEGRRTAWERLVPREARPALEAYRRADLVVAHGGTYLVPHYDLSPRIFEFGILSRFGAPLVFFTQSLGPFPRPEHRRALLPHFQRAPLVLVRDERSRRHLCEIGVDPERVHVHADAVFSLAPETAVPRLRERRLPSRGLAVVVSVRFWRSFQNEKRRDGMRRYVGAVAAGVAHLVRAHGARVTFVSTCQGIPEYWANDAAVAAEVRDALPAGIREAVEVDGAHHSTDELLRIFGQADVVFATRMHAGILALISGTPVLPVAYEFKTRELFEALGMGDAVLSIDDMTGDSTVEAWRRFLASIDARRESLARGVALQIESARAVVPRLRALAGTLGGGRRA